MGRSGRVCLPALLTVVSGLAAIAIGLLVKLPFPLRSDIAKPVGYTILGVGMLLIAWSVLHIREAFLGEVEPRTDRLAQGGPYRFARHPVYLGMTIALVAVGVSMRSWLAVLAVFLLFLPGVVYRARLEEKALAEKYGREWEDYAERTPFLLPFLKRR
ncbi:MAG: isoprenylcysteine carboxylmethyltransferase family protein [Gemmatimonadota bacterium]|nr:MAG: isoprenylcysteine carboxylmethyltransferase family protein [Gemmatimonadota bacterium]